MPIKYPDVSKDFQKLIKTLANLDVTDFDFWDDLTMGIYKNSHKPKTKIESYFKGKIVWFHGGGRFPTCPELDHDWSLIDGTYVQHTTGTRYKVNKEALLNGPLKEYATDGKIPVLFTIKTVVA